MVRTKDDIFIYSSTISIIIPCSFPFLFLSCYFSVQSLFLPCCVLFCFIGYLMMVPPVPEGDPVPDDEWVIKVSTDNKGVAISDRRSRFLL